MDKNAIINDIKANSGAEIAALQQKFNVPYKEVKAVIDELVAKGALVFESGVKYSYAKKSDTALEDSRAELERRRAEAIRKVHENLFEDVEEDDAEEKAAAERRAYLEARRQELIRRMQETMPEDDDDDEDDDNESENDDDEEIEEDELRYKALKLIIEKNAVSVSMFQRSFPIGYIRSCKLVDWMESKGYISAGGGSTPRRVLITKEELDKIYSDESLLDDDDEDLDIDTKFAEYEKFLEQHFDDDNDDGDEEDEEYDNIINRIFHSDADDADTPDSNSVERKAAMQNLASVLSKITDKKKAPISADEMPSHHSWDNEDEFADVVMERMERLIKSDKRMGQQGAVKKAETYLEAVRDTHDRKMVQVYERLVYEIKNTSSYLYGQLKKQYFS